MRTTTVRLDPAEERLLDELAQVHGGRSPALRAGLRLLGEQTRQRRMLDGLLRDWEAEAGPVGDGEIAAAARRYEL